MIEIIEEVAKKTKGIQRMELEEKYKSIFWYINDNFGFLQKSEIPQYFFILIDEELEQNADDILGIIEEKIEPIRKDIERAKAINTNVIIVYKANEITDELYKKIISIEENPFIYKKNVLYYTSDELKQLKKWYEDSEMEFLDLINDEEHITRMSMESPEVQLYLRILIKLPFVKFKFKEKNLSDLKKEIEKRIKVGNLEKEYNQIRDFINKKDIEIMEHLDSIVKNMKEEIIDNEN